jgi:predicted Zn-dependent protease
LLAVAASVAASVAAAAAPLRGQAAPVAGSATNAPIGDALDRALRDELARSMSGLRLGELDRPYFIAYRVDEIESLYASGARGALLGSGTVRARYLTVELRVGDYTFDNSNFYGGGGRGMISFGGRGDAFGATGELPLDDDYTALRRQVWLATDAAYKEALESINAKRAAAVNRMRTDSLPDFWRADIANTVDEAPMATIARADAESLVRALSATPELSALDGGGVRVRAMRTRVRYVNSEGTSYVGTQPIVEWSASGVTRGGDGTPLAATTTLQARSPSVLGDQAALRSDVRRLALRLDSLRRAPTVERYKGPVLFETRAAAQLFAESFAPALMGRRGMQSDVPGFAEFVERAQHPDGDSLLTGPGSRVLPAGVTVVDDATRDSIAGQPLLGGYAADDEGVLSTRTVLVEDGVLRGLLATRTPSEGATRSTGNRRGGGVGASNMIVESKGGVDEAELRRRLMAAVQKRGLPWGLVVRELASGGPGAFDDDPMAFFSAMSGRGGRRATAVYRVYPDGREELVRPMQLGGLTAATFRDIAATSRTLGVFHQPAGLGGGMMPFNMAMMRGGGSPALASFAVPSLLFEDVALGKAAGEPQKPPIIPAPGATRTGNRD